jgi:hypothetical protein
MLICLPEFGLGNRLSAVISAMRMADILKTDLAVCWQRDRQHCDVELEDIFHSFPFRTITEREYRMAFREMPEIRATDLQEPNKFHTTQYVSDLPDRCILRLNAFTYFKDDPPQNTIDLSGYAAQLILKPALSGLIEGLVKKYDIDQMIGVHIRKTDKATYWHPSGKQIVPSRTATSVLGQLDYRYLAVMQHISKRLPDVRFLVATDEPDGEKKFAKVLEKKIFAFPKRAPGVRSRVGVYEAIVDMWLLSRCKCLIYGIGTYGVCSSKLSNKPKVNIVADRETIFHLAEINEIRQWQEVADEVLAHLTAGAKEEAAVQDSGSAESESAVPALGDSVSQAAP